MSVGTTISGFSRGVQEFQRLGLINKAVLDVTAVDVPLIALAKNPLERQERFVRQALVLLIAFLIAPLHAKGLSMGFGKKLSKQFGLKSRVAGEYLLRLRFKELTDARRFKKAVAQLYHDVLKKPVPLSLQPKHLSESMRQSVLRKKSAFSTIDWVLEGLLFASVGFVKVMFGQWMTGKKQFTGEMQLTSEKTLDTIYKMDAQKNQWMTIPKWAKQAVGFFVGAALPLWAGRGLYRAHQNPLSKKGLKPMWRKLSQFFDYNYFQHSKKLAKLNWPMLSNGAIVLSAISLSIGDWLSSRSVREFKELFIQRNVLDVLFFAGAPLMMKAISGSVTVDEAVRKAKKSGGNVAKSAKKSARSYVAAYLLNMVAVSVAVYLTNEMTKRSVKKASITAQKFQHWAALGGLNHA